MCFATPDKVDLHPIFNQLKKLPSFPLQKHAMDMISHETIHCRQGFEKQAGFNCIPNISSLAGMKPKGEDGAKKIDRLETKVSLKSFGKYSIKGYLSSNVEVQARMHEIMSQAYAEWERMPVTKTEFFAAMHHTGMKLPPSIIENMESTDAGRVALLDFKLGELVKDSVKRPVDLLNNVYDYAHNCYADIILWNDVYPVLYGNLLELYGDKLGRERMGLGQSPRNAFLVLTQLLKSDDMNQEDIDSLVDEIPQYIRSTFLGVLKSRGASEGITCAVEHALNQQGKINNINNINKSDAELDV